MLRFALILALAACGAPPDVPPLTADGPAPALLPLGALPEPVAAPAPPDLSARLARLRARAAALR